MIGFISGGDEQMPHHVMVYEWKDGRYLQIIFGFVSMLAALGGAFEVKYASTILGELESVAFTGITAVLAKKGMFG